MSLATPIAEEYRGWPEPLARAQQSMHLPEVQEMLKRLSAYNLGICMPHMHDDATGSFAVLPDDVVQVEDEMKVTFRARAGDAGKEFIPVGWSWRADAHTLDEMCVMKCEKRGTDTQHYNFPDD